MGPSLIDVLNETLTQEFSDDWAEEVWTINMSANIIRCDICFWMDDLERQWKFRPRLIESLNRRNIAVMTSQSYPEYCRNSYDYPIEAIGIIGVSAFGKPYLNNGVAMAVAYALYKGVKILKVYGADFSYPNRDYAESGRACVEAWITYATLKGMVIMLCPSTSLFDTVKDHGIYGYSEQPEFTLADGTRLKYTRKEDTAPGKYQPEDSSGVRKKLEEVHLDEHAEQFSDRTVAEPAGLRRTERPAADPASPAAPPAAG